ncbi:MAG: GAF domain-containing protein, partial [Deltaproteobacteria bacterium]|nr:GAF domain-containing protein [Deltaproteobacteria bacterium]
MNEKSNAALVTSSLQSSAQEVRRFDRLESELARSLVRITVDEIDAEINGWLKRIMTSLGLDRSAIADIDPMTGLARFTHGWACEPDRILSSAIDINAVLPWTKQKMLAGETVVMSSPDKLPKEAAVDRESFHRYGTKSNVMVPIKVGGMMVGAMSFASLYQERSWSPDTVHHFQAVAQIFGFGLERKRAITEMLRLRNELSYVSRVTTMAELAASMAHELNQPLGAILNNAEAMQAILASDRPDLEEVKAGIADIIQDNNRAREIIHRVWALFQRGKVTRSKIDVAEMLGEIRRIVRSDALMRNVSLLLDVKQPIPPLFAERVQMQQAIINLILNAFDAVASIDDRPREVHLEAVTRGDNGSVQIFVRDSGKGIAPDDLPKIFDTFFTTKPNGMGMGLAIAKSIIEAQGGRLSV